MRRSRNRSPSVYVVGIVALVVAVIGIYLGFTKAIPFQHHFTLKAVFRTSNNVRKASFVRIAGVNVGKVTDVQPMGHGRSAALVTMRIDPGGLPIHTDATVKVRPRIFLEGNFFVDLHAGTPSAPAVRDGYTLPIQQASSPVQLDQVLGALQKNTRRKLQILLAEYGTAVREGGAGYNKSIQYWKDAYENSSIVNQATLGEQPHDLSQYIAQAGVVAQAIDRHPAQLQSLLRDFNVTARAFARERGNLEATIAELPRTLRAGQPALAALDAAFPNVRRLARVLDPGVRSTGPTIDASLPFIRQARLLVSRPELRGLIADLVPTVPALERLTKRTIPLYRQVRLASSCQNEVILPWTHDTVPDKHFPAKGNVYYESVKFLPGISGESRAGDANGQWFRVLAGGGTQTAALGNGVFSQTLFPVQGFQPPKPQHGVPIRPSVPCETQQRPDLAADTAAGPRTVAPQPLSPTGQLVMDASMQAAIKDLRGKLDAAHLPFKVADKLATPAEATSPLAGIPELKKP